MTQWLARIIARRAQAMSRAQRVEGEPVTGLCGDCYGGSTPDEFADIECCCCGAPCVTHDDCESCNDITKL